MAGMYKDKAMETFASLFRWALILILILAVVLFVGSILAALWAVSPVIPVALFVIGYSLMRK